MTPLPHSCKVKWEVTPMDGREPFTKARTIIFISYLH